MRLSSFFILLLILVISIVSYGQTQNDFAQNNRILVDDFEKPGKKNLLNGDFGAFADNNKLGNCYLFFIQNKEKDKLGESKYSLYIQWDTSKKGAYGGFWTKLNQLNVEDYNYVSFYVKGNKGNEVFKVGIRGKMEETFESKVLITKALEKGVTTDWQKAIFPLKMFKGVQDWNEINIFSINFENAFGSGKGAVLIDEISFEK